MVAVEIIEWGHQRQRGKGGSLNGSERVVAERLSLVRGDSLSTVLWRAEACRPQRGVNCTHPWGLPALIRTD